MGKWHKYSEEKPPYGEEVIAYNPKWVDEDFNPKGIRIGFIEDNLSDDGSKFDFVSAYWWNDQDTYETICKAYCFADDNSKAFYINHLDNIEPEYWMEIEPFKAPDEV